MVTVATPSSIMASMSPQFRHANKETLQRATLQGVRPNLLTAAYLLFFESFHRRTVPRESVSPCIYYLRFLFPDNTQENMRSSRLASRTKSNRKRDSSVGRQQHARATKESSATTASHDDDSSLPFPPAQVKQFLRQANLTKLIEKYQPSRISQEPATKSKQNNNNNNKTYRLRKLDIVCGRGNVINKLPGNVLMRRAVAGNQKAYLRLDRGTKSVAADAMISFFETWGIRFLEPVDPNNIVGKSADFLPTPYVRVHEKVMQALRQKTSKKPRSNLAVAAAAKKTMTTKKPKTGAKQQRQPTTPPRTTSNSAVVSPTTESPSSRAKRWASRGGNTSSSSPDNQMQAQATTAIKNKNTAVSDTTSSLEGDDDHHNHHSAARQAAAATPIELQGSFVRPVPAPVLSLASFLRNKLKS